MAPSRETFLGDYALDRPRKARPGPRRSEAARSRAPVKQQRRAPTANQRAPCIPESLTTPLRRQARDDDRRAFSCGDERVGAAVHELGLRVDSDNSLDRHRRVREQAAGVPSTAWNIRPWAQQSQRSSPARSEPGSQLERSPVVLAAAEGDA